MREICDTTISCLHVISEPGDGTHYNYIVARDGPDNFCFMPLGSTFSFPQRLNWWQVCDYETVSDCISLAAVLHCNPYTLLECVRTMKEIRG